MRKYIPELYFMTLESKTHNLYFSSFGKNTCKNYITPCLFQYFIFRTLSPLSGLWIFGI